MKAAFSLSPSVSFAWTCFAHLLWLSVGLSFLNQSLKSSGIHKPCFVSSERTVMCSKLGQAGAARSVLSRVCAVHGRDLLISVTLSCPWHPRLHSSSRGESDMENRVRFSPEVTLISSILVLVTGTSHMTHLHSGG